MKTNGVMQKEPTPFTDGRRSLMGIVMDAKTENHKGKKRAIREDAGVELYSLY